MYTSKAAADRAYRAYLAKQNQQTATPRRKRSR
jgi:hypothetical protein